MKPQLRETSRNTWFSFVSSCPRILRGAVILMRGSSKRSNKKDDYTGQILIMSKNSLGATILHMFRDPGPGLLLCFYVYDNYFSFPFSLNMLWNPEVEKKEKGKGKLFTMGISFDFRRWEVFFKMQ